MANSYIPLYRKYRPQTFSDLVGQEAISKTLSNAIKLDKVAHAYLFTGPRGTGKTSSARIFAKALNCDNGPTDKPCGVCPSCVDITNGNAIDVIEIDAASNRKVEDARNILEKVQFVPVAGRYKIYIIDEVHMLTNEAFNTLLKTLEEPPKNLVFILATTDPHKVLETIISRCQRFDFRRITQDAIVKRLREIATIEKIDITDSALSIIARKSAGGMRDSVGLLDQASVLSLDGKKIDEKDIINLIGSVSEDALAKIVDIIAQKDAQNLIPILNEIIQLGNEPVIILRELMGYFRNLMLIKTTSDISVFEGIIEASSQLIPYLQKQAESFEAIELAQIIERLAEDEKQMKLSSNQHLWLEVALVNTCYRQDIQVIKDLEQRLFALEEKINSGNIQSTPTVKPTFTPVPAPIVAPPAPKQEIQAPVKQEPADKPVAVAEAPKPQNIAVSTGDLKASWTKILENIDSLPSRMMFQNLSKPVEVNSERIIITFANETFVKQSQEQTKKQPLENAAYKIFGRIPNIVIRTPDPTDAKIQTALPLKAQNPQPQQASQKINTPKIENNRPIENKIEDIEENIPLNISSLSDEAKIVADLFQGKIIE